MAAGGFKEFVAGETLDEDEINDFLMQGMLVFAGTAARGSAVTAPVEGQFCFLKDSDTVEFYDGSDWVEFESGVPSAQYLIVGGGGGASESGGGAGGYRCSVPGEDNGGGADAELPIAFVSGSYTVTVGAGGAAGNANPGTDGNNSVFGPLVAVGGGGAGARSGGASPTNGRNGGSGGGGGRLFTGSTTPGGVPTFAQGFAGGGGNINLNGAGGGGGGAGAVGVTASGSTNGAAGGDGVESSITGTATHRAGGGGSVDAFGGTGFSGGLGGGGQGAVGTTAGGVNTGGGGGGGLASVGSGGSGIVILKYPSSITLTIGAGLTSTTATSGDFKITSFTAGTDTVSY